MSLSEEDIKKLAVRLSANIDIKLHDNCKFTNIDPEDLEEVVKFYKNFNKIVEEGKITLWKTLVIGITTGTMSLILLGIWHKIKEGM